MRAALLDPSGNVCVREVAPPEPVGRALVRVDQAGVCGDPAAKLAADYPVRR
jgi:threonine dehydrogenase-like Zn-dependent dehydrogenase